MEYHSTGPLKRARTVAEEAPPAPDEVPAENRRHPAGVERDAGPERCRHRRIEARSRPVSDGAPDPGDADFRMALVSAVTVDLPNQHPTVVLRESESPRRQLSFSVSLQDGGGALPRHPAHPDAPPAHP